jgi:hypothetical protein
MRAAFALIALLFAAASSAAPLPKESVPDVLKSWIPWVMDGHEAFACPPAFDNAEVRECAWPSELELDLKAAGGTFRYRVTAFTRNTPLALPGDGERWPQDVKAGNAPLAVVNRDDRPHVLLPPGEHVITGSFHWREMPQDLPLPPATGVVRATVGGKSIAAHPDAEGSLWLRRGDAEAAPDSLSLRVFRLVDDDVPMTVTTRYEIAAAGRPRELALPAALLPEFQPTALESPLPARLAEDGRLRVQVRPGNWSISVTGRRMAPATALELPKEAGESEEIWSFHAHNDVRLVSVEGPAAVDPKQTGMPDEWKANPAYRLQPGDTFGIKQSRRGDPDPAPDELRLMRRIWLDFDGGGYTFQDTITGRNSRSWRLEVAPPIVLGRVAVDGLDQLVTRMDDKSPYGVEVRQGTANIAADSRIPEATAVLPATAWQADFANVSARLHLPPGWRLLHAGGVDRAGGAWLVAWNLWDFFFVLISSLAAAKLFGRGAGLLFAAALVLTWQVPGAPRLLWPAALGLIGLQRVLPGGRLLTLATWAKRGVLLALALVLLPFAVTQVRQAIYPSLEVVPSRGDGVTFGTLAEPAPAMAPPPAQQMAEPASPEGAAQDLAAAKAARRPGERGLAEYSKSFKSDSDQDYKAYRRIDPKARIQTGPGLPTWQWRGHELVWQGPVERTQQMRLWLLPPWATALWKFASLLLAAAALWVAAGRPRRLPILRGAGTAALAVLMVAGLPTDADAAAPPAPASAAPATPAAAPPAPPEAPETPTPAILDELRDKLTASPDCLPACASLARLHVAADRERVRLRLELHAQEDVMAPLPGQPAQFRPDRVMAGSGPATLRRKDDGSLWIRLSRGVTQVVMETALESATSVQIALPMPPREVTADAPGWTLAGLDARGIATGGLTLTREGPSAVSGQGVRGDALPPFVRVERTLGLGERWTVQTTVSRQGPSPAPVVVRIPLIAGEAVNDPAVRVEDGFAIMALGQGQGGAFSSTVKEAPKLRLTAGKDPNQIEVWRLDADTRWHVALSGIPPVHYQDGARWLPLWQPWPGESVEIAVSRPAGVAGQTLTLDGASLVLTPGRRATDVAAMLNLRSSQGGNHALQLPPDAQLLSVAIDGNTLPLRAEGRTLTLPVAPGAHKVNIGWREPRGIQMRYATSPFATGIPGVNASLEIAVPTDRWVIAVGGPLLGPAVLFWGVVLVIVALAWALARFGWTTLGAVAWFLLGIGLAQASLGAAAVVVGWFLALAARRRYGAGLSRRRFNLAQFGLAIWTLAALLALVEAVRAGLLGYPDMLVRGNGSSGSRLLWYQDRLDSDLPTAWMFSVPLYVYRGLMLAWALWLARSVLEWARWAWGAYSDGGYWRAKAPGEGGLFSRKKPQPQPEPEAPPAT